MSLYSTLEEAIDNAREEFTSEHTYSDREDDPTVAQLGLQKYVMQDGEIMWQAEFLASEDHESNLLSVCEGEAAQAIFDGDFDETELLRLWQSEDTLHEWDEGEFYHEASIEREEGEISEWEDDNSESERWA